MDSYRAYLLAWRRWVEQNRLSLTAEVWLPMLLRGVSQRHSPPQKIGDIGCGLGDLLFLAHEYFPQAELVGVDSNPLLESEVASTVPSAKFVVAEADSLPAEIADSDILLTSGVAHLLSDDSLERLLLGIRSNLVSGGTAIVSIDDPVRMAEERSTSLSDITQALDTSWDGAPETSYLRSQGFYEQLCRRCGFACSSYSSGGYLQFVLR